MKRLIGTFALLVAIGIPAVAQMQRMSLGDQDRFNSYYSRWLQYKQNNDRDDMISMEQRMQDLMAKYGMPLCRIVAGQDVVGRPAPFQ